MERFNIDAPPNAFFAAEKQVEGEWKLSLEGQLFTGLEIVVGNRIMLANEKEDKSLWTSAVQEIVETAPFVVVRTKNSTYRLRKI